MENTNHLYDAFFKAVKTKLAADLSNFLIEPVINESKNFLTIEGKRSYREASLYFFREVESYREAKQLNCVILLERVNLKDRDLDKLCKQIHKHLLRDVVVATNNRYIQCFATFLFKAVEYTTEAGIGIDYLRFYHLRSSPHHYGIELCLKHTGMNATNYTQLRLLYRG